MCAISGSYYTDKLRELVVLNSYRGQHSHSISYYNRDKQTLETTKKLGSVDLESINIPEGHYGICHTQAPTTDAKDVQSIHPAITEYNNRVHALWHNGIIKNKDVERLQEAYGKDIKWDTQLLLEHMVRNGTPDGIDGTFSCLWCKPTKFEGQSELFLFRNDISPMFIDNDLNISSTKFEGSRSTPANQVCRLDIDFEVLVTHGPFSTKENPYYFWD